MALDHSRCAHPRTPAGRAACRKAGGPSSNLHVNVAAGLTLRDPAEAKLDQVRRMAIQLIEYHLNGWTFAWDRSSRRYGQCRHGHREIGISRAQAISNPIDTTRDVVLHEIAHALVGHGAGHGPVWRAKCAEIGLIVSNRYVKVDVMPPGSWVGTCPNGHTTNKYRRPRNADRLACTLCCRAHNGGVWTAVYRFTWRQV